MGCEGERVRGWEGEGEGVMKGWLRSSCAGKRSSSFGWRHFCRKSLRLLGRSSGMAVEDTSNIPLDRQRTSIPCDEQ